MIDTHAHIYLEQFESDLPEVMQRCEESAVERILMPNIDHTSIEPMMEVEHKYPHSCQSMIGLHPCSVDRHFEKELYLVEEWLDRRPFIAIGEIGTDLYWDKTTFKYQKEAFTIQVNWARERNLPVVIHCRDSIDETIELLEPNSIAANPGVFHCFTGNQEQAERIIAMGFKLGIGGVVTFKNSGLDQTLEKVALEHLVMETDSPYLAPVPFRGKRNQPAYLPYVLKKLAEIYQKPEQEIVQVTTENAIKLFKLDHELSGDQDNSREIP